MTIFRLHTFMLNVIKHCDAFLINWRVVETTSTLHLLVGFQESSTRTRLRLILAQCPSVCLVVLVLVLLVSLRCRAACLLLISKGLAIPSALQLKLCFGSPSRVLIDLRGLCWGSLRGQLPTSDVRQLVLEMLLALSLLTVVMLLLGARDSLIVFKHLSCVSKVHLCLWRMLMA